MTPKTRARTTQHETLALLLGRTAYGESDLVVSLFTHDLGKVSALARGARKSKRRFAGTLEPLHTLRVVLRERTGAELLTLEDSSLGVARSGLLHDLAAMEAAGTLLRWVRASAPLRTPERDVWDELTRGLDDLGALGGSEPLCIVATTGLRLLTRFGWALELGCCAVCGKPCPTGRAATVSPRQGGVVCQACGGGQAVLSGKLRERLVVALDGSPVALSKDEAQLVVRLVQDTLRAHADLE